MDALATRRRLLLALAFAAVWLVWGSTYLVIAIGIETIPPFIMAGLRFLVAGTAVLGWCATQGIRVTSPLHWRNAALIGGLMLVVGNGGVTWAEQTVQSSVAALIITTVPLWMTFLDSTVFGGRRATTRTWFGLALGFCGMVVLLRPSAGTLESVPMAGALVLLMSSCGWANGSLLARRIRLPQSPLAAIGAQMTAGGVILLTIAALTGDFATFRPGAVTVRSWLAVAYLAVFGSILSLSAYMYLLRQVSASAVGTYAFVNPVIAVLLGWWLAGESLTPRVLLAGAMIVLAVVVILVPVRRRRMPVAPQLAEESAS